MFRVLVLDDVAQEGLDLLDQAEGIEYEVRTGLKGEPLRAALAEFDGAVCRSGVKITAESLEGNRRLRAIVRAGVGTDNIDKPAATRHGIVVMNTPTGNTLSTAEHTFALMLGLSRNVAAAYHSLQAGRWDRKHYMGTQLADKVLGIVGLGRIGQEVARRAVAFGMRVIGLDPFLSHEQAVKLGINQVERLEDMLPNVDYLTVHTPLTSDTRHLIGRREIELLKPGVRLINAARGGIYDEAALAEGLRSGKLAGVALDVFETEPCTASPLFELPGVLCTPHLGASTEEAQTQVAVEAVHLLIRYLTLGEVRHAVNMAAIDPTTLSTMVGSLNVAYRLGRLLAQWHGGAASACCLDYRGEVARQDTQLLTASFCAGLLERALEEEVNIVNSEMLMKERGIQLVERRETEMGDFSSSITAELSSDGKRWTAAGTLFGNRMPRLIRLDHYRLEAYLDGILFIFTHQDVPGIIGKVGTAFGAHHVNIAQMSVGREGNLPGGTAVGVLNLDAIPPHEAIDAVLNIDSVQSCQLIELPPAGQLPPWLHGVV
jgi:D-3-phosphoglycerate dehydrogenase / 2-oxoglutarate reductase